MYKIGFQNFRKFIDFNPIEYRGITLLVGRNNSGKSTIVKALLLINEYFKSGDFSKFHFGDRSIENANIVTFGRAKNASSNVNSIKFFYQFDKFQIDIHLTGNIDNTYANVISLDIFDSENSFKYQIKPIEGIVYLSRLAQFNEKDRDRFENQEPYWLEYLKLEAALNSTKLKNSSKEYLELVDKMNSMKARLDNLNDLEKELNLYKFDFNKNKDFSIYKVSSDFSETFDIKSLITHLVEETVIWHDHEFPQIQNNKEPSENFEDYRGVKLDADKILNSIEEFNMYTTHSNLVYIAAQTTKQSAIFLIRDKQNPLAQAIHEFYQSRITKGEKAFQFIEKWIKRFEIGDSFEIKLYGGEAYEVRIISGKEKISLSDKGMGSLQAMTILLRISSLIQLISTRKWISTYEFSSDFNFSTVVIEEPELNFHPALQSLLADLFYEVYSVYKINLIVETHSEYLVRKTQLIVKENELEIKPNDNPFCVFYFDTDLKQKEMPYREDGKFIEEFGTGFFDETRKIVKKMME